MIQEAIHEVLEGQDLSFEAARAEKQLPPRWQHF